MCDDSTLKRFVKLVLVKKKRNPVRGEDYIEKKVIKVRFAAVDYVFKRNVDIILHRIFVFVKCCRYPPVFIFGGNLNPIITVTDYSYDFAVQCYIERLCDLFEMEK